MTREQRGPGSPTASASLRSNPLATNRESRRSRTPARYGNAAGDLLALFKPQPLEEGVRTLKVMAGLVSMIAYDKNFAEAVTDTMIAPWAEAHRALMQRAMERKEISADADLHTLSRVAASMAGFRTLIERKPFTREFLVSLIDSVILPALRVKPPPRPARRGGRRSG